MPRLPKKKKKKKKKKTTMTGPWKDIGTHDEKGVPIETVDSGHCFQQGRDAYNDGIPIADNPFPHPDEDQYNWLSMSEKDKAELAKKDFKVFESLLFHQHWWEGWKCEEKFQELQSKAS